MNQAREVIGLATGAEVARAVAELATGQPGSPAARLSPQGRLTWFVDRAAAGRLVESRKRAAAHAAAAEVRPGMCVGLGTGSTAALVLEEIGARLARGELLDLTGVATSSATADQAGALGIPLHSGADPWPVIDLAIDGADEVDGALRLIKGGGGALLREKIVAAAAARFVVVVDDSKQVEVLGRAFPLPVEIVPFGWRRTLQAIEAFGAAQIRGGPGEPVHTDNGNLIVDCRFEGGISDPAALDNLLKSIPGVVETGLFIGLADAAYVGTSSGVERIVAPPQAASPAGGAP
jgi:ribose 5-phosphate isomerase A